MTEPGGAPSPTRSTRHPTIIGRPELEAREDATLAPWGARAADSRGRRCAEEEPEYRTCYMRDRDRIVHSTAFRRLEYKTQVFVNHKGDYYRTRLTHTIETAQIARTIAKALGCNEDLTEAVALAHDLGHTPFGHAGQDALDELMREHGGFEHNRQSLRVVDVLEQRYAAFRGLNLSYEVRESIVKHSPNRKGFAELGIDPETGPLLEAQIADAADSIAYDNHDIDDGLKAGAITLADLDTLPLWRRNREQVEAENAALGDAAVSAPLDGEIVGRQVVRRLIGIQVADLIEETGRRIEAAGIETVDDVRAARAPLVGLSDELKAEKAALKRFLFDRVYRHYAVCRMAEKAKRFITGVFEELIRYPKSLPPDFRAWADEVGLQRAVADYVAGMTDRFAQKEYQRLFAPFEIE